VVDFERLDAAIEHAVEHPAEFDMASWFSQKKGCGTTACLAGTAAAQAGWLPVWTDIGPGRSNAYAVRHPDTGEQRRIVDVGAQVLGLYANVDDADDEDDSSFIFFAGSLANVILIRNGWARDRGVPERTFDLQPVADDG
jgi:hypothetical protein